MLAGICVILYISVSLTFSDIDECFTGDHYCHVKAICTNIDGSFNCTCNAGYIGNGISCIGNITPISAMQTFREHLRKKCFHMYHLLF